MGKRSSQASVSTVADGQLTKLARRIGEVVESLEDCRCHVEAMDPERLASVYRLLKSLEEVVAGRSSLMTDVRGELFGVVAGLDKGDRVETTSFVLSRVETTRRTIPEKALKAALLGRGMTPAVIDEVLGEVVKETTSAYPKVSRKTALDA